MTQKRNKKVYAILTSNQITSMNMQ